MRKYLMTWYGITDFRASLGLTDTIGPVLGALLAEDYTDVTILGFTKPGGLATKDIAFRNELAKIRKLDIEAERKFLDLFLNTKEAHDHFIRWLHEQLLVAGKTVTVRFHPIALKCLNDTEGIYQAATQSLNDVAVEEGKKLVTLYLSPGTPVMAFVWAFAALRYPNLKKRLIASSEYGKPPETIVLPNEWMEWHGRQIRPTKTDSEQYDVIYHLFGEQRMPSLLGVLQFPSRKHIFVNSAQFPADVMKQFLGDAEFSEIAVDPYNPENVRSTILDHIAQFPVNSRIGFNLTGGTKLMYAGALAACRKVNATPFYFNSSNNQVVYLNDFKRVDVTSISSVETFIKLNGNNLCISKSGCGNDIRGIDDPHRKALTKQLWIQRSAIAKLYKSIAPFGDKPGVNFQFKHKKIFVRLKEGHKAEILIAKSDGKESAYRYQNWPDFAKYLSGGWFEEYIHMILYPFLEAGQIKDLRIGLQVSFKEDTEGAETPDSYHLQNRSGDNTYQEFDILFTNGKRLYVVECKAGYVSGEHVRKLESITRYFGGIEGKGILACCFPPSSKVVRQKVKESRNVVLMAGKHLEDELKALMYRIGGHN